MSIHPSVFPSISIHLSIHPSVCLSIHLHSSVHPSIFPSISIHLSIHPSVWSVYFLCLSVCLCPSNCSADFLCMYFNLSCIVTKPTKWHVRPSKTQISLGIRPIWSRVFTVRLKKAWVLSYPLSAQQRLWSEWADAQADLSLHWAMWLICLSWILKHLLHLI